MKCYFVFDEVSNKKILIPGCHGSLHQDDLSNCCCQKEITFKQFEKQEYNIAINDLNDELNQLKKENNSLIRIIERLTTLTK